VRVDWLCSTGAVYPERASANTNALECRARPRHVTMPIKARTDQLLVPVRAYQQRRADISIRRMTD